MTDPLPFPDVEWRSDANPVDYPIALADMEARAAAIYEGDARERVCAPPPHVVKYALLRSRVPVASVACSRAALPPSSAGALITRSDAVPLEVAQLPSPAKLEAGDPGAEKAFDDFLNLMERLG